VPKVSKVVQIKTLARKREAKYFFLTTLDTLSTSGITLEITPN